MSILVSTTNLQRVHRPDGHLYQSRRLILAGLWVACLVFLLFAASNGVSAQAETTYVVASGDTLGEIATRFGVSVEALAAANAIADINQISIGQTLVIPGAVQTLPTVISRPGEMLADVAARAGLSVDQLAAINELDPSTPLFPGQPIVLPPSGMVTPFHFGAVTAFDYPVQLVQGKTGWLQIASSRPVSIALTWNGLPLALNVETESDGRMTYTAHIPVPALLGPGSFPLELAYTARSGVTVRRTVAINVVGGNYTSQEIDLPPDRGALLASDLVEAELITVTTAWGATETPIQWRAPFVRPIGTEYATTSAYGIRRSYDGGPYNTYHAGQDFGAPVGVTVTVPADGIVSWAGPLIVRGNAVIIDHGVGVFTGYWHLSEIFVEAGQAVSAGDALGLVGNTGLSTGAHLHWELRIYGIAVDPLQFLDEALFPEPPSTDGG